MSLTTNKTSVLENVHAIRILLILLDEGPMRKTIIHQKITTNTTSLQKRLTELEANRLITIVPDEAHHSAFKVELTARGRRVAEHLKAIEEILQG